MGFASFSTISCEGMDGPVGVGGFSSFFSVAGLLSGAGVWDVGS
jgi:hypothetical protein